MSRNRILTLALAALALAALAYWQLRWRTPEGPLTYLSYSTGGGMMGGHSSSVLRVSDDGSVTLTTSSQGWHGDREATRVYEVDPAYLDQARDIVERRHLVHASGLPMSDLFPLDADTWTLSFTLGEYDHYSVSQYQVLDAGSRDGVGELAALMAEAASSGTLLSETLSPREVFLSAPDGYTYMFEVNDSQAATDLCEALPLEPSMEVRGDEVVLALPTPLDVTDAPKATGGEAGTLAYRASTGELVIECAAFEPEEGLYELGTTDAYYVEDIAQAGGGACSLWTNSYEW